MLAIECIAVAFGGLRKRISRPLVLLSGILCMVICSCGTKKHVLSIADTLRIEHDIRVITQTKGFRNYRNVEVLNSVAE